MNYAVDCIKHGWGLWMRYDLNCMQVTLSITWDLPIWGRLCRNFVRNFGERKKIMLQLPFIGERLINFGVVTIKLRFI